MSIGLAEASWHAHVALKVLLAIDTDKAALALYQRNLPDAEARVGDVTELFDGNVGEAIRTSAETQARNDIHPVDVLLGGPPCQGHSDLNNHTRRLDPKNELYLRMARVVSHVMS